MFGLVRSPRGLLLGALVAVVLAASLGGLAASSSGSGPAVSALSQASPHVQKELLTIAGARTNERVFPSSGNIAIAPGVPVRVTVTNYTSEYHTFTIPGLHASALIFPARGHSPRKTTFTFKANTYGSFAWHCAFCTGSSHGQPHAMGGMVYAIIDPSVLP